MTIGLLNVFFDKCMLLFSKCNFKDFLEILFEMNGAMRVECLEKRFINVTNNYYYYFVALYSIRNPGKNGINFHQKYNVPQLYSTLIIIRNCHI